MERLILSNLILSYPILQQGKRKKKEKRKHFSLPTSRRKTDWEQFFVSFRSIPFRFRSVSVPIQYEYKKGSIRYAICFLEKEKKTPHSSVG